MDLGPVSLASIYLTVLTVAAVQSFIIFAPGPSSIGGVELMAITYTGSQAAGRPVHTTRARFRAQLDYLYDSLFCFLSATYFYSQLIFGTVWPSSLTL